MKRGPKLALLGALTCLAGLVLTGLLALRWPAARAGDRAALHGFTNLDQGPASGVAHAIANLCDPGPYLVFGVGLVAVALLRRRRRLALALPIVLVGAPATAEILKWLVATPRSADWLHKVVGPEAWPSGHSTAALTLALAAVLVAPRRLRPAVAVLGAGFAVAVAYSVLVLAWHFPSDVLGGYLVAALWTLLAVAALLAVERRRPPGREPDAGRRGGRPPLLWPVELGAGLVVAAALAVVAARPAQLAAYAAGHTFLVLGGAAIAALALALTAVVARTLGR